MRDTTCSVPDEVSRGRECAAPSHSSETPNKVTDVSQLDELAHSLAYNFAASVIDGEGITMRDGDDEAWDQVDAEGEVDLFDCLRYLQARGLLERHPHHPDWVRVRDESEAIPFPPLPQRSDFVRDSVVAPSELRLHALGRRSGQRS